MNKKLTFKEFVFKSKQVHKIGAYTYPEQKYTNTNSKVKIFCVEGNHYFMQLGKTHLMGKGCYKCKHIKRRTGLKKFIIKANKIHKNTYTYPNQEYINSYTKLKINCNNCGLNFLQSPVVHLSGSGCPNCGRKKANKNIKKTFESFVEKSNKIHFNKYKYFKNGYTDRRYKAKIYCKVCKDYFYQTPNSHLDGHGCHGCSRHAKHKESKGSIYLITCLSNGKKYIGITSTKLKLRLNRHFEASNYKKSKSPLHDDMKIYGLKNFKIEKIVGGKLKNILKKEQYYINKYKTKYPNGYNKNKGGLGLILKY